MRSAFLGIFLLTIFLVSCSTTPNLQEAISPTENLMYDHGVLNRILLIYQEIGRRIDSHTDFPAQTLSDSAKIVQDFLENYHEKLEEKFIFPVFEKTGPLADLVKILKDQHQVGRALTSYILSHSSETDLKNDIQKMRLADYLRLYVRMLRPHEAREDTVLFPAFRRLISPKEYAKMGTVFENKEYELFGKDGFEKIVNQVAEIEKTLGIHQLSQFTPQLQ